MKKQLQHKIISFILAFLLSLALVPTIAINASNEDIWTPKIIWSLSESKEAAFSKDYNTKYGGEFSLKIQNFGFDDTCFAKTISTEKNTIYKISAMVRYEGYQLQPVDKGIGGANISIGNEWTVSEIYNQSAWKKIELEFNSGNRTSVTIYLRNGFNGGACKGTAWFSNVQIEKKDMTQRSTEWNFLCLIYKNIDVTVDLKNNSNYHYKNSYSKADVKEITSVMEKISGSFKDISGNLMTVSAIDIFPIESAVTNITEKWGDGYCINTEDIQKNLDLYLAKKTYNQIIVVAPLGELADGWYGLGGGFYKNIGYAQVTHKPGNKFGLEVFPDAIFIHETLHCIESRARDIKTIAELHDAEKYGYNGKNEWKEWYRDYMRDKLSDGKGLPKEVYTVYNGDFTIISASMSSSLDKPIPATEPKETKNPTLSDSEHLMGELIGTGGWSGNKDIDYRAAFDGSISTFFDPEGVGDKYYTGMKLDQAYILTEVRILPRENWLNRFKGATIQGSNDGKTWTTLWESAKESEKWDFQIISADNLKNNTGWTYYRYVNNLEHGDVAEIEFWGKPAKIQG